MIFRCSVWAIAAGLALRAFGAGGATSWGTATVRWNFNSEPDVVAYRVYCTDSSALRMMVFSAGRTNVTRVTGLPVGATYYFMVTAVNRRGAESPFSRPVSSVIKPVSYTLSASMFTAVNTVVWDPYSLIQLDSISLLDRSASSLATISVEFDQGAITMRWQREAGVALERATRLDAPDWTPVPRTEGKDIHQEMVWDMAAFYRLSRRRSPAVE